MLEVQVSCWARQSHEAPYGKQWEIVVFDREQRRDYLRRLENKWQKAESHFIASAADGPYKERTQATRKRRLGKTNLLGW